MKTILAIISAIMAAASLAAQNSTPTVFGQVINELASVRPPPPTDGEEQALAVGINLNDGYFVKPANDPAGKIQRAMALYAAAGRAREINNFQRISILAAEAKSWFRDALPLLASKPSSASHCHYYLGLIAEHFEGNISSAAQCFQQALVLNPDNGQANQALERIQHAMNPTGMNLQ
jgi:tetratricopeptide (TPR) repeat protein